MKNLLVRTAGALLIGTLAACDSVDIVETDAPAATNSLDISTALVKPDGVQTYPVSNIRASAYQDPNTPDNAIDDSANTDSRWSALGRDDVWLELDLGAQRLVNTLDISFFKNDERNACFHIQTSNDGSRWVDSRSNISSDGQSVFSIPQTRARYIRYVGLGNSENEWNSILEVKAKWLPVTGDTSDGSGDICTTDRVPDMLPEARTYDIAAIDASDHRDPNVPQNVIDGSEEDSSRWSAKGRTGVWLEFDLGSQQLVNTVDLLFLKNDERHTCFNIQTSNDGANWITRRSNIVSNGDRSFSIAQTNARYLRFIGLGNSSSEWNSIIEARVQWLPPTGSEEAGDGESGACDATAPASMPVVVPVEPVESPEKPTSYEVVAIDASDYQDLNFPENTIDELTEDESRWSAEGRAGVWLEFDLGTVRSVNTLDLFFLKSGERNSCFSIQTSNDGSRWQTQRSNIVSNGERVFSFPKTDARYVRFVGHGNSESAWNSIIEAKVQYLPESGSENTGDGDGGCPSAVTGGSDTTSVAPTEQSENETFTPGNTDSTAAPGENFDLTYWKITYPDASEAYPPAVRRNEFYTDVDTGAMVFECVNRGERTSNSTKYARSELREMLRGPNTSIGTKELGNNWVTSAASSSDQRNAGGVDGNMKATVSVDRVSTSYSDGNDYMLGRVIVGQIHGSENEPFKIYYRKLPGNSRGSVYFSYEDSRVENYYELFGSRDTSASNPADGIELGEKWSYEVDVSGRTMMVKVTREDGTSRSRTVTWGNEYDDDWFYFKAGNYNQNNGGDAGDHARVSIFSLDASHN